MRFRLAMVAVGDETHGRILDALGIVVVVLDDHQAVAALDLFLGRAYVAPDALVEAVGAFVRAGDDDCLVASVAGVCILEALEELAAVDRFYVGIMQVDVWYVALAALEHLPQHGGVVEYSRVGILAHDVRHRRIGHVAERAHGGGVEGGGAVGPHGRQLGVVAHEYEAALAPLRTYDMRSSSSEPLPKTWLSDVWSESIDVSSTMKTHPVWRLMSSEYFDS